MYTFAGVRFVGDILSNFRKNSDFRGFTDNFRNFTTFLSFNGLRAGVLKRWKPLKTVTKQWGPENTRKQ